MPPKKIKTVFELIDEIIIEAKNKVSNQQNAKEIKNGLDNLGLNFAEFVKTLEDKEQKSPIEDRNQGLKTKHPCFSFFKYIAQKYVDGKVKLPKYLPPALESKPARTPKLKINYDQKVWLEEIEGTTYRFPVQDPIKGSPSFDAWAEFLKSLCDFEIIAPKLLEKAEVKAEKEVKKEPEMKAEVEVEVKRETADAPKPLKLIQDDQDRLQIWFEKLGYTVVKKSLQQPQAPTPATNSNALPEPSSAPVISTPLGSFVSAVPSSDSEHRPETTGERRDSEEPLVEVSFDVTLNQNMSSLNAQSRKSSDDYSEDDRPLVVRVPETKVDNSPPKPILTPKDLESCATIDQKLTLLKNKLNSIEAQLDHIKQQELAVLTNFITFCSKTVNKKLNSVQVANLEWAKKYVFHWINEDEDKAQAQTDLPSLCIEMNEKSCCTQILTCLFGLIILGLIACAAYALFTGAATLAAIALAYYGYAATAASAAAVATTTTALVGGTEAVIAGGAAAAAVLLATFGVFKCIPDPTRSVLADAANCARELTQLRAGS